jgi:hypothetical protein
VCSRGIEDKGVREADVAMDIPEAEVSEPAEVPEATEVAEVAEVEGIEELTGRVCRSNTSIFPSPVATRA